MFLSLQEIIDVFIMTFFLGFLFKDLFENDNFSADPLNRLMKKRSNGFWMAVVSLAPSIILHELAHKFTAMGFGLQAVFHAFYANSTTLFLGVIAVVAKITGFGMVFLVPGFVSIRGVGTPLEFSIIAFAGPMVHGLFYLGAKLVELKTKNLTEKQMTLLVATKRINGFLFILNMLPIPGVDGFSIYSNLIKAFSG